MIVSLIVFIYGGLILVIILFYRGFRQCKKYKEEDPDGIDAEIDNMFVDPEKLTETFRATVVDMVCYAEMTGTKRPKSKRVFIVSFETENGEILKINVPEEMYNGFDKGQTGMLTLVDGILYSFELE